MKGVARRDTYQHSYEGGFARRARAVQFVQDSFLIFCHRIIFLGRFGAPLLSPMFSVSGGGGGFSGDISLLSLIQNLQFL